MHASFRTNSVCASDALNDMPDCADQGKTAVECGDIMMQNALSRMGTIIDGIHDANPDAKIVGVSDSPLYCRLSISPSSLGTIPCSEVWDVNSSPSKSSLNAGRIQVNLTQFAASTMNWFECKKLGRH